MKLKQFDYNLPKELIAVKPASPRDSAQLLVYNKLNTKIVHTVFRNLGNFLRKGDALVLNDTKVIPARIIGRLVPPPVIARSGATRQSQALGRKFKILLLEKKKPDIWSCLIDGKKRSVGQKIVFANNFWCVIIKRPGGGIWEIKFNRSGKALENLINKFGEMPLPPYIKQGGYKKENKNWYQTVFAKYAGSAAAPTAGLHFTPRLLKQMKKKGVKIEYITLHVGMGTFAPVKESKIESHKMHKEFAVISAATAENLNKVKAEGGRIIACGTTAARTLESFAVRRHCEAEDRSNLVQNGIAALPAVARNDRYFVRAGKKYTDVFIYPPYKPKFVDALITNFHLPKSTLMMLVSAFLSPENKKGIKILKKLYTEAIKRKYRFYSYGDAMLII